MATQKALAALTKTMGVVDIEKFKLRLQELRNRSTPFVLTSEEVDTANACLRPWLADVQLEFAKWTRPDGAAETYQQPRFVQSPIRTGTCALWLLFSIFPRADHLDNDGFVGKLGQWSALLSFLASVGADVRSVPNPRSFFSYMHDAPSVCNQNTLLFAIQHTSPLEQVTGLVGKPTSDRGPQDPRSTINFVDIIPGTDAGALEHATGKPFPVPSKQLKDRLFAVFRRHLPTMLPCLATVFPFIGTMGGEGETALSKPPGVCVCVCVCVWV